MKKEKRPRNSVKAVIIRRGKLLVLRKRKGGDVFYVLPGGGQDHGETLEEALLREVHEEAGARVTAGDLLFVREYRGRNHEFRDDHHHVHQVEFFFRARLKPGSEPKQGKAPDSLQEAIEWISLAELARKNFYPKSLRKILAGASVKKIYRGDVN